MAGGFRGIHLPEHAEQNCEVVVTNEEQHNNSRERRTPVTPPVDVSTEPALTWLESGFNSFGNDISDNAGWAMILIISSNPEKKKWSTVQWKGHVMIVPGVLPWQTTHGHL